MDTDSLEFEFSAFIELWNGIEVLDKEQLPAEYDAPTWASEEPRHFRMVIAEPALD